jgi:hypothetical protein
MVKIVQYSNPLSNKLSIKTPPTPPGRKMNVRHIFLFPSAMPASDGFPSFMDSGGRGSHTTVLQALKMDQLYAASVVACSQNDRQSSLFLVSAPSKESYPFFEVIFASALVFLPSFLLQDKRQIIKDEIAR